MRVTKACENQSFILPALVPSSFSILALRAMAGWNWPTMCLASKTVKTFSSEGAYGRSNEKFLRVNLKHGNLPFVSIITLLSIFHSVCRWRPPVGCLLLRGSMGVYAQREEKFQTFRTPCEWTFLFLSVTLPIRLAPCALILILESPG